MRRRLCDQHGFAVILALLVLIVIGLLSAVVVSSAVTANEQSNVQTKRRMALQAANTGLQTALYRLSAQPFTKEQTWAVNPTHCFTNEDAGAVPASGSYAGYCTGSTVSGSLGSAGSYTYDISQALVNGSGPGCTGFWVEQGTSFYGITQRCITATGTYKGVTRRVQERVAAENWAFPVNGILSLGIIEWDTSGSQHLNLPGTYQANGYIMVGKGTQTTPDNLEGATLESFKEIKLGPGETCPASCKKAIVGSRFTATTGPNAEAYQYASEHNNDAALTTGVWAPGGKPAYIASTKEFVANKIGTPSAVNSSTQPTPVVMPAGTYFFCEMKAENSAIEIAGQTTIYIGSPGVGGCPGQIKTEVKGSCTYLNEAGTVTMKAVDFWNPSRIPSALQIFVWGNGPQNPECEMAKGSKGQIAIENPGNPKNAKGEILPTASEIYAPDSFITTTGEGIWWQGGLVVGGIESNDNDVWQFTGAPSSQEFFPAAWTVCPVKPSSSADAGSGCY